MDMIERVARALIDQIGSPWPYGKMDPAVRRLWRDHARAAIEAMREPTEAMLTTETTYGTPLDGYLDDTCAEAVWDAMITAALKSAT
jgi:hypothetical protein